MKNTKQEKRMFNMAFAKNIVNQWLLNPDVYVLLDTETTGVHSDDEICEIAITDTAGNCLLHSYVRTQKPITAEAAAVNHITEEMLSNAPTFPELWPQICKCIEGKIYIAYNSSFDTRMLRQELDRHKLDLPLSGMVGTCAMKMFGTYCGKDKTKISLQNAMRMLGIDYEQTHSALDDCHCLLNLLRTMVREETDYAV